MSDNIYKFNPRSTTAQLSPFGETYTYAGKCAACARNVYSVVARDGRKDEPDPRGFAGPRHSLTTFEEWPRVMFCWDCVNEHGSENYQRCRAIADAATWGDRIPTGASSGHDSRGHFYDWTNERGQTIRYYVGKTRFTTRSRS